MHTFCFGIFIAGSPIGALHQACIELQGQAPPLTPPSSTRPPPARFLPFLPIKFKHEPVFGLKAGLC